MSLFNTVIPESNQPSLIFDEIELKRNVHKYIDRVKIFAWYYNFNRIFISPGNSFNLKYLIKFLSKNLAKRNGTSKTNVLSINSDDVNRLISQELSSTVNDIDVIKYNKLVQYNEDVVIDDVLDMLTDKEFFRLLNIEPTKRLKTLMSHYHAFNKILDDMPIEKLDKLSNNDVKTEVPYEIYIESSVPLNTENEYNDIVNTVDSNDLMGLLKTCGVIVIDISRGITSLSRGKEIFRSFKKEIVNMKDKDRILAMKNKRLIVLLSTVMTWTSNNKKHAVSEDDAINRIPNPEFKEHYEFELEVLAVNKTNKINEILTTIVVWTGLTYGFEQDIFKFAFDSACKSNNELFPIPSNQNFVPVIHVENLARLLHKVITESYMLKNRVVFATERPTNTLKHIITALGKTSNVGTSTSVSLNEFINKYKLEGLHKQLIAVDIKVNSSISRLWPDFEWYNGKSSMVNKMKYLVETYKREHNIKSTKLLILGPSASGKTKLAHQVAKHYNLIYLEPLEITKNHINEIIAEIMSLRQISQDLLDDFDDETKVKEIDPIRSKKIFELEEYLKKLYSSMDSNNGLLEDNYLIPLLIEKISYAVFTKCGYVLDGYPTTTDQVKQLFGDMTSLQQIDVNKLPDLTIYLKQETQSNLPYVQSDYGNAVTRTLETKKAKRQLLFSELNNISSSDPSLIVIPKPPIVDAKSILKKTTKNNYKGKPKTLIWNEQNHNNLLKMISSYYVPIKTIDSPQLPLQLNSNKSESMENDLTFLNIIVKEIEINHGLLKNINKMNSTSDENNNELKKNRAIKLMEKMTLLGEFEKVTDFEHIESLTSEEYLMKYVTPNLTKLIVQVAKVRPRNPVYFLAHMALKENPEGLPEFPGYSKEGLKVKTILEHMFRMTNDFNGNNINSNILLEMLTDI